MVAKGKILKCAFVQRFGFELGQECGEKKSSSIQQTPAGIVPDPKNSAFCEVPIWI